MPNKTPIENLSEKVDKLSGNFDRMTSTVTDMKSDFKTFPRVIALAVGESFVKHIEDYHQKTSKPPKTNKTDMVTLMKYSLYIIGLLASGLVGKALF